MRLPNPKLRQDSDDQQKVQFCTTILTARHWHGRNLPVLGYRLVDGQARGQRALRLCAPLQEDSHAVECFRLNER